MYAPPANPSKTTNISHAVLTRGQRAVQNRAASLWFFFPIIVFTDKSIGFASSGSRASAPDQSAAATVNPIQIDYVRLSESYRG